MIFTLQLQLQVNNAGHAPRHTPITKIPLENVDDMMAMHMHGPLLLSQLFMDELIKSKGIHIHEIYIFVM